MLLDQGICVKIHMKSLSFKPVSVFILFVMSVSVSFAQWPASGWTTWGGTNQFGEQTFPNDVDPSSLATLSSSSHTLAVTASGQVRAWGRNQDGECNVPGWLESQAVVSVAAGSVHSLALTSDGKVAAWGENRRGECDVPASLTFQKVTAIAAAYQRSMALTMAGEVVAWGANLFGEGNVPDILNGKSVIAISAGYSHNLALTDSGQVVAWGDNSYHQCDVPRSLTSQKVVAIAAGGFFSAALTNSGHVIAWGSNSYGEVKVPPILASETVVAISAGDYHCMALTIAGKIYTWGSNFGGNVSVPVAVASQVGTKIVAGQGSCWASLDKIGIALTTDAKHDGFFTGGKAYPVTGTVSLARPPVVDTEIQLSSSDPSVSVPASVTVKAQEISATFDVKSIPVATVTGVTITAMDPIHQIATNELIVKPQYCLIRFEPSTFEGGMSGKCLIKMGVPSATDTVIHIDSYCKSIMLDGISFVVPANHSTATFAIGTKPVTWYDGGRVSATPGISTDPHFTRVTLIPAPRIGHFSIGRPTIYGNQKNDGIISLRDKPGPAGATVSLDVSGVGLNIPKSVFFPEGVVQQIFRFVADEGVSDSSVFVTATIGVSASGKTIKTKQLKVVASSIQSDVKGGQSCPVTIRLNAVVDVDTEVKVTTSDSAATKVPDSVKVPAGSNTVTYTLITYPVKKRKAIIITASKGGYTSTKTLVVRPE
jgi:Regulator of chromosome condensation (RCC1) repeat